MSTEARTATYRAAGTGMSAPSALRTIETGCPHAGRGQRQRVTSLTGSQKLSIRPAARAAPNRKTGPRHRSLSARYHVLGMRRQDTSVSRKTTERPRVLRRFGSRCGRRPDGRSGNDDKGMAPKWIQLLLPLGWRLAGAPSTSRLERAVGTSRSHRSADHARRRIGLYYSDCGPRYGPVRFIPAVYFDAPPRP